MKPLIAKPDPAGQFLSVRFAPTLFPETSRSKTKMKIKSKRRSE